MGLFDFLKKKKAADQVQNETPAGHQTEEQGIDERTFGSSQFQAQIIAYALMMHERNKTAEECIIELKKQGLNTSQAAITMQKMTAYLTRKNASGGSPVSEQQVDTMMPQTSSEVKSSELEPILTSEIEAKDFNEEFAALLGYQTMQDEKSDLIINQVIQDSLEKKPIVENPIYKVCESGFQVIGGVADAVKIRNIFILRASAGSNFVYEAFPYLQTERIIPFKTTEIVGWKRGTTLQAEIVGAGQDTFKVGFYATDFAANKSLYNSTANLNIRISAFAFVIDKSDLTEIDGTPVAEDFSTYMPNKDFKSNSHYDFIGKLLSFTEVNLGQGLSGYIMSVKLIHMPEDENFFTIDIFVNKLNLRCSELTIGMKITGAIWLQGEISN